MAACSLSSFAPLRVAGFDPRLPRVPLAGGDGAPWSARQRRGAGGGVAAAPADLPPGGHGGGSWGPTAAAGARPLLPERLTPEHVRALLRELRANARRRGLYRSPADPDGQHLVIAAVQVPDGTQDGRDEASPGTHESSREAIEQPPADFGAQISADACGAGAGCGLGGTNRRRYVRTDGGGGCVAAVNGRSGWRGPSKATATPPAAKAACTA